jgi:hypothetical protein
LPEITEELMRFPVTTLLVGLVTLACAATPAHADGWSGKACTAVFKTQIARLGIAQTQIAGMTVTADRMIHRESDGPLRGYDAWIRLTDCRGALVLSVSRTCRFKGAYTTGDCRRPGLPRY